MRTPKQPGSRGADASYEISQKKRKIKAAQTYLYEKRTGQSVPKTLSQSQDLATYIAEAVLSPSAPHRDQTGKVTGYGPPKRRKK